MENYKYNVAGIKYTEEEFRQMFFNESPCKSNEVLEISDTEDKQTNCVSSRSRPKRSTRKAPPKVIMKINLESDDETADDDNSSPIKNYEKSQDLQRREEPAEDAETIKLAEEVDVTNSEHDAETKSEESKRLESIKRAFSGYQKRASEADFYSRFCHNVSQPNDFFNNSNATTIDESKDKLISRPSTSKLRLSKRLPISKSSTPVLQINVESEDEEDEWEPGALAMLEIYENKSMAIRKNVQEREKELFVTSEQSNNSIAKNNTRRNVIGYDKASKNTVLSKTSEKEKSPIQYRIWKSKNISSENRFKSVIPEIEISPKLCRKPDNQGSQTSFKQTELDRKTLPSTSKANELRLNNKYKNKPTYVHQEQNQNIDISHDRKKQRINTLTSHNSRRKLVDKSDEFSEDETFWKLFCDMEREDVGNIANLGDQLHTAITCRVVRFGTYRYEPKEKVLFTSKGMKVVAPSCKNPPDAVVLNIQIREIVKIVAHFSKSLNILFIYTLPACGSYVRESLEMKPKSSDTPYYNPLDRAEPYKRIVLQMDGMIEEHKTVIRSIFTKEKLEEIQCNEANELLVRSCMKDKYLKQEQGSAVRTDPENIRQILIYPPGKGGMPINTEDYMCLANDQYLNDVIIDFFLKYLHLNILTEEQRPKTHIFSSFFYNRLTTMTSRQRQSDKDLKLTASQKRHARVKSWTKNVNLFEKDFIIIPINEQSHWFLAIVCFPRLQGPVSYDTHEPVVNQPTVKKKKPTGRKVSLQIGSTPITRLTKRELDSVYLADDSLSERDEAEGDDSDLASDESDSETPNGNSTAISNSETDQHRPIKQPLILIFDSLAVASRSRAVATLRDYLTWEYRAKIKEDSARVFNNLNMPGHCVKVPQQNNLTDCGLYVLQYVEQFFKDPIKDYKLPIKQLVNWFETIVVTRKREEISNLLKELVEKYNPDRLPLPEIAFPTLNGTLVEPEATDEQAEFEEEEMEDAGEEEDDGEASPLKRNGEKRIIAIGTSGAQTPTIALKRPLESELTTIQDPMARKTARLSETN